MVQQSKDAGSLIAQTTAISKYIGGNLNINSETSNSSKHLGLELEHFIVRLIDDSPVPYLANQATGASGIVDVLEYLSKYYDEKTFETQPDGSLCLVGLSRKLSNITLEPGAQLEISIGPLMRIEELEFEYQRFRDELDPILEKLDLKIMELGYHPTALADDIDLLPKGRYHYMDRHFKTTGKHGKCMMRASASTQVSIDFSSEEDAIRKLRVASLLTPFFAFITDNSPIFEKQPITLLGNSKRLTPSGLPVPNRMARTAIWNDVDADRSMIAPKIFEDSFDFSKYAEVLLNAPAIFSFEILPNKTKSIDYLDRLSFKDLFNNKNLNRQAIEHILSLFFYDVRLKTYIEIRAADSMPIEFALAYAALIKGVFYNESALLALEDSLAGFDFDDIAHAKEQLCVDGYDAIVYQRPAEVWLDELMIIANGFLDANEKAYLEPLISLVALRKTLVDQPL